MKGLLSGLIEAIELDLQWRRDGSPAGFMARILAISEPPASFRKIMEIYGLLMAVERRKKGRLN